MSEECAEPDVSLVVCCYYKSKRHFLTWVPLYSVGDLVARSVSDAFLRLQCCRCWVVLYKLCEYEFCNTA